ncbi:MAG TPA: glycosyltransferase family 4 protein [Novosphingobium sp.]|nr:glycosyltransferase family 4 protein [Novosphingobium sp.]
MSAQAPTLPRAGAGRSPELLRLLFALPGFHRYDRGAEVALLSVAAELAREGDSVTVAGSGPPRDDQPYAYRQFSTVDRRRFERLPPVPVLRSPEAWEDMIFAARLAAWLRPGNFDALVTCSFPFTHWALRRPGRGGHPLQVFVTQNGDWPARRQSSEFRSFRCDGLICTNPDYYEQHKTDWPSVLIPNGVNLARFGTTRHVPSAFGLRDDRPTVLMVSALIESKRVAAGIAGVAELPDAQLIVAGDGPLRNEIDRLGTALLGTRYRRVTLPATEMPRLYGSADVFLHLSTNESFGNVFVEARASGLPVVAHDLARTRWIVGNDQFLCDTSDPRALAAALGAALARGPGAPAADIARFAWPTIAAQYRTFIAGLRAARA